MEEPSKMKHSQFWNNFKDIGGNRVECKHCAGQMKRCSAWSHIRNSHKAIREHDVYFCLFLYYSLK
ncbi:unnamed protein product [Meloidogyne enterolobii]|uniref:Uncharacterized protein n=1 Tax=Meloidogyne enterolobii TaxID=390850 RepID=A0ACB1AUN0_MELEN